MRREFNFVHAGVAGALKEQIGIHRKNQGLGPVATDHAERRLDCRRRIGVGHDHSLEGVVDRYIIVPTDVLAMRFALQRNVPHRFVR